MADGIELFAPGAAALIGAVHLRALPGTPNAELDVEAIVTTARREAEAYRDAGFDAVIVENMHDRPYLRRKVGPEIVATMTAAAREVATVGLPFGVQCLAGANRESMAIAGASGAAFVRVEGFVFGHVADEGWIEADAGELLRFRRRIGAESVWILADVKKKHAAHQATADVDLAETARAAEFFLADGLIVTGTATGRQASPDELDQVRSATALPVWIGSGISAENLERFADADGWIVGSWVKEGGHWTGELDPQRLAALVEARNRLTSVADAGS